MKKLFAAWLCAVVVACAASPKQAAMSGAQAPQPRPQTMPEDSHSEIQQLSDQIDQQRQQMNLPAPTQPTPAAPMTAHTAQPAQVCTPVSQTCKDTCTIGDTICSNADRICKLADGMPGDEWAANKCSSAKQTCTDAHTRCCECS